MRRAVTNWAAGVTLVWLLAMTLWLPWLDSGKSYRSVAVSIKQALPAQHSCIASKNVGPTQRAMLQYHAGLDIRRNAEQGCDWLLTQGNNMDGLSENRAGWKKIWEGGRPSDKDERFRLYRKIIGSRQSVTRGG